MISWQTMPTNYRALVFRTEIAKLASSAHLTQRADESQLDSHELAPGRCLACGHHDQAIRRKGGRRGTQRNGDGATETRGVHNF